jgi:peptidoglycan/xylan/chitin deacetylase (PgdA/CDA1 family)
VWTSFLASGRTCGTWVLGEHTPVAQHVRACYEALLGLCRKELPAIGRNASIRGSFKRLVKLAISLLYFSARALSRFVLELVRRSPDPQLIILYYHGIPRAYRSNFVRQLESIGRGARVVRASHHGSLPSGKRNVAITFDDAYVSVAENALPELASRGFHSTIFVPIGSLGSRPTWTILEDGGLDSHETVMSAEQIARLPCALVTLGSHTTTHPHLSRIDPRDAQREIENSRLRLQALTAQDIRLFAFPYGDHDASTVELCRAAGYDYVFSIAPAPVDTTSSAFVRGRVKVDPFDWPLEFFLKCHGAYAWISQVSSLKRKLSNYRRVREVRRLSYRQPLSDKQL